MYEKETLNFLRNLSVQVHNQGAAIANMEKALNNLRIKNGGVIRTVPFGVKDITTAQLVDAYKRGLQLEELVALGNGKYTPEQITNKIRKSIGG